MSCNNEPCFEVKGKIQDFDEDVEILSITRTTLNWRSNQPIAGSEINVPPQQADRYLLSSMRHHLGLSSGFMVQAADCPDRCYCHIPPNAQPQNVTHEEETYEVNYMYLSVRWLAALNPHDPTPDPGTLFDGSTGQGANINPESDHLGPATEMNPGLSMGFSFPLYTRFLAKVRFKVKVELFELRGECKEFRFSKQKRDV